MSSSTEIVTSCPLCPCRKAVIISRRARDGSPLTTVVCRDCGLVRTEPLPDPEALAAFYRENYRLLYKKTYQPRSYHVLRAARLAAERIERLGKYLVPGAFILDAGCGGGEFLYLLRSAGCRVIGIEPNLGYATYAREELGLEVHIGLIGEQNFSSAQFDGITLFHVLEHIPAPVDSLRRLAGWLKPGGFLAVEVPNFEAKCGHPAHRFHRAHLFHFTPKTLARCGLLAGLEPVEQTTSPDEGVLWSVFRLPEQGASPVPPASGGYERLRELERTRSAFQYWLSLDTWRRALQRTGRMAAERMASRRYGSRRQILDETAGRLRLPHA